MDEYLEEEAEWIKDTLAKSSKGWESKVRLPSCRVFQKFRPASNENANRFSIHYSLAPPSPAALVVVKPPSWRLVTPTK